MIRRTILLLLGCLLLTGCIVGVVRDKGGTPVGSVTLDFAAPFSDTLTSTIGPITSSLPLLPTPSPNPPPSPPAPSPQPAIVYFSVSPPVVNPGESATLSWRVIGREAYITALDAMGRLTNHTIQVPLSGTRTITTSVHHYNQVMYRLSAVTGSAYVADTVYLNLTCLYDWFFDSAPDTCPLEGGTPGPGAEQRFEGGTMVWVEEWDRIFVLYDDAAGHKWDLFSDEWNEGEPENDPDVIPPEGFYQPVRGFGKVWREESRVRERLGYAVEPEQGYSILAQRTAYPKYNSFYLLALNGNVWHLGPEGSSWEKIPFDGLPAPAPADSPQIVSFNASPSPADPQGTVTLSWEVHGASSVSVSWLDKQLDSVERSGLPLVGELSLSLSEVKFYGDKVRFHLLAHDADGELLVVGDHGNVLGQDLELFLKTDMTIAAFSASPDPIEHAGTVTLNWDAPNASRVSITRLNPVGIFSSTGGAHDLPASGSVALVVPEEHTTSVHYWLFATDDKGVTLQAYLIVGVICPYDEHLADECPITRGPVWAAYQPFEGGHMIWRGDTGQIYVLYQDGSYEQYEDTWQEGEPVPGDDVPPAGLFKPARGFGKLWATEPDVRDRLGWATAAESGYTMLLETVQDYFGRYPSTGLYLTLPDGRALRLYGFPTNWEVLP